jgi:outer membrane lipoprotein-sorting protein
MINQIISLILLITIPGFSQVKDPETILQKAKSEFEKIEDYQVDVKIKVDVYFLKMPDRTAKILYKKPDKFNIESKGFALLPKEGFSFSPLSLLGSKYTSFYEKEDTIKGIVTSVIKVIPLEGSSDVILSTLWVDTKRNIIVKIESSRKPSGNFTIDFDYLKTKEGFYLPSSMVFSFSVDKSIMPRGFDIDNDSKPKNEIPDSSKTKIGKVYLNYSNYIVNKGIPDEVFIKQDEKQ